MIHKPYPSRLLMPGTNKPYFRWQFELALPGYCNIAAEDLYQRLIIFYRPLNHSKLSFFADSKQLITKAEDLVILQPAVTSGNKAGKSAKLRLRSSALHFEFTIHHEREVYTNMTYEMTALISLLFFMYRSSGDRPVLITITMGTNVVVHFDPKNSLVRSYLLPDYCLQGQTVITRRIQTLDTMGLATLLQEIMIAFTTETDEAKSSVSIDMIGAFFNINFIKRSLRIYEGY